jgi:hypothetical protein
MQGRVILETQKEHEIWLASAQANAPFVVDKESADVFWGWKWLATAKNN